MEALVKKELILEGLDCANCAAKIEDKIKKLESVEEVSLNFITKTLSIETFSDIDIDIVIDEARTIVNTYEPHVIVKEKNEKLESKVYILKGLTCASCATKIERMVNDIKGIESANIDFVTMKLDIKMSDSITKKEATDEIKRIVKRTEPHVEVIEESMVEKEESNNNLDKKKLIRLGIGSILFLIAIISELDPLIGLIIFITSYLLIGGDVLSKAVRNIIRGQVFDENFLMTIATIGAFAVKEYPEGVAVMFFYQIGEMFQDIAVNRSRRSIKALLNIRPDYANLKVNGGIRRVKPEDVEIGDLIVIKPGEKVPLDGRVIEGKSMVNTSALTGESVPRKLEVEDEILSGFVNESGLLTVEVAKKFGDSTVTKILDLVQNASSRKAPTENFITKFARYYTPVVVITALLLAFIPPILFSSESLSDWVYRSLIFLVISCPCALVVSIPLGFFGGIGSSSKSGILVKGGNYLEALNSVETVVFDKTGTLTKGVFKVTEILPEEGFTKDEILELAAYAEVHTNHPIGKSIRAEYGKKIDESFINAYEEVAGHGIKAKIENKDISIGNSKLMIRENINFTDIERVGTTIYIGIDGRFAGSIVISDELKDDGYKAIEKLRLLGVKKIVMLTGDNKEVAEHVGKELSIDEVHWELLPQDKVEILENLEKKKSKKGKIVFIGDGINDAPVLARADIGIAMGGLGSDAAIEAADIVLMTDELKKLPLAINIARRTKNIVIQNIVLALGIKAIVLLLGALGMATMWEAVFADVGVALLAVLNSMRALKVKE